MKRLQISNAVALVVGLVMAIWGGTLPLHQRDMASQTTGEFIAYIALTVGGVLIALTAFFGLVQSSRKRGTF
jgi:TRAP-type C4-dicarboxylate transport system permease small subunit